MCDGALKGQRTIGAWDVWGRVWGPRGWVGGAFGPPHQTWVSQIAQGFLSSRVRGFLVNFFLTFFRPTKNRCFCASLEKLQNDDYG